jgi:hypothetical protein
VLVSVSASLVVGSEGDVVHVRVGGVGVDFVEMGEPRRGRKRGVVPALDVVIQPEPILGIVIESEPEVDTGIEFEVGRQRGGGALGSPEEGGRGLNPAEGTGDALGWVVHASVNQAFSGRANVLGVFVDLLRGRGYGRG